MKPLLILLLLTGCAGARATRFVTVTPEVPAGALQCAADPAVPEASGQAVVATYIVALWQAGEDCRDHVAAIRSALAR